MLQLRSSLLSSRHVAIIASLSIHSIPLCLLLVSEKCKSSCVKNQPQLRTIVCIKIWLKVFLLASHISLAKAIHYKLM